MEDKVNSGYDAISRIEIAIIELEGIEEYAYIVKNLKEDINEIKSAIRPMKEKMAEKNNKAYCEEQEELNNNYLEMVRC